MTQHFLDIFWKYLIAGKLQGSLYLAPLFDSALGFL